MTVALIVANVVAYLWQLSELGLYESAVRGGAIPYEILTFHDVGLPALVPPPLTIFSSMFLHGGFLHLAGNMLFLWIFGNNVENALGPARFLLFYLGTGVAAAVAQVATASGQDLLVPMIGASGAVSGVLGAYIVLWPNARILTLIPIFIFIRIVYVPAYLFIGLWFVLQLVPALVGSAGSGVAFMAHVGGFVAGYLFVRLTGGRPRWAPTRESW
ncbi:MAG TPA: rhomboid family intramembrane serine protease [Anaeromyxobacteraceae bacterium]|nr:rhomboid family intramembrane serine protease [Anaeromyxobacteraceae bacterium]